MTLLVCFTVGVISMRCNSMRVVMSIVVILYLLISIDFNDRQKKMRRHSSTCFGDAFGVQNWRCNFAEV